MITKTTLYKAIMFLSIFTWAVCMLVLWAFVLEWIEDVPDWVMWALFPSSSVLIFIVLTRRLTRALRNDGRTPKTH